MAIFPTFFLGNIGQVNIFYDILERKNAFLGYRNKKLKKSKNWHFGKGVNPWFLSKNGHFSTFFLFLGNIGQENVFYDILERISSISILAKPQFNHGITYLSTPWRNHTITQFRGTDKTIHNHG